MINKKLPFKLRANYIFNAFALGLFVISLFLINIYQDTKEEILRINHDANIAYVHSLSDNLASDITHIVKEDFFNSLGEDYIAKEYVESNLQLFVTTKYKYIHLISKNEKGEFIYLADASSSTDKKHLNQIYRVKEKSYYDDVYRTKSAIYFQSDDVEDSWATYLSPIIVNEKIEAIIVVKFSIQDRENVLNVLNSLGDIFKFLFLFFIIVFIVILWFSSIDKKREEQKELAYEELQKSNINLHNTTLELQIKSDKVSELNDNLEDRVRKEVTKNRAKDAQLIHQARLAQMGEMISMIAHQWRQPLTSISATSNSLHLKSELGTLSKELLIQETDNINKYAQYLSDTIDDFRNFFRINRELTLTSYDELIESVSGIIAISLANKQIKVIKELDSKDSFESYPNELKQVILNLVKNAEDAVLENNILNPEIKIKTYLKDSKHILEVSDNGGGIDDKIIDKVFDPYFSTKLEKDGTGLGLYMSKMIIKEHCRGDISVKNIQNGVRFTIVLGDSS